MTLVLFSEASGKMIHEKKIWSRDNLRGQKSLGPLKMSLEMAHKVIVPPKKIRSRSS